MKRLLTICAVAALVLAVSGLVQAGTIASDPDYKASTDLSVGAWTTIRAGTIYELTGYQISDEFQLNLLYQAGILDSDIDNINHYWDPMGWNYNFGDNEEYLLNVSATGGLTIYEYDNMAETPGGSEIKWTLTAWHQTILAGDIIDNGDGTITLQVLPVGTYRPFVGDPPVNNVEVFDGDLDCEVLGYTFTGAISGIGNGSVLSVNLAPAPTEVWVDDDFDNSTPGWGTTHFATIQDGIDAVAGSTVYVAAGTYAENLVINKPLILQGAGSGSTTIDASTFNGAYVDGITVLSSDVTIQNLSITNANYNTNANGMYVRQGGTNVRNNITLNDVVITGSNAHGVRLDNAISVDNLQITNCQFTNNAKNGLNSESNTVLSNVLISDSNLNQNKYGLYLEGTVSNATISGSTFNNSAGGYGGYMTETGPLNGLTVEDCEFKNNVVGLMVWNVQDNADITITGSSFQDNDKWGVLIWGNSLTNVLIQSSSVLNNNVLGTTYYGIDFYTYGEVMTNVAVHYTNITGHTIGGGVKNRNTVATAIVDATYNWWGDVSGPYDPDDIDGLDQYNPDGLGDAVTEYVLYDPWIGQPGMVTGGGWIDSPPGAYMPIPGTIPTLNQTQPVGMVHSSSPFHPLPPLPPRQISRFLVKT